jgi:hypothetical protein
MTKDKIDAYFAAREALLECFDIEYPELIEDNTEYEWTDEAGGDLNYIMDGDLYSFDSATPIGEESEGYELFNVYDNGREFYALFKTSNKVVDEDEIEEKFDW